MKDYMVKKWVIFLACIVMFFLAAVLVMWLWNNLIPWIIGFPPITYWQAAGLILLSRILIGGFGFISSICHHRGYPGKHLTRKDNSYLHDQLRSMTPEQRRDFVRNNKAFFE